MSVEALDEYKRLFVLYTIRQADEENTDDLEEAMEKEWDALTADETAAAREFVRATLAARPARVRYAEAVRILSWLEGQENAAAWASQILHRTRQRDAALDELVKAGKEIPT